MNQNRDYRIRKQHLILTRIPTYNCILLFEKVWHQTRMGIHRKSSSKNLVIILFYYNNHIFLSLIFTVASHTTFYSFSNFFAIQYAITFQNRYPPNLNRVPSNPQKYPKSEPKFQRTLVSIQFFGVVFRSSSLSQLR